MNYTPKRKRTAVNGIPISKSVPYWIENAWGYTKRVKNDQINFHSQALN